MRNADRLAIWRRDAWHCRYCLSPVFFAPTLKLLEELSPGHGYYHPNGKAGEMLPLFQWGWATVHHVVPVAAGGGVGLDDRVTSCWRCNSWKNDGLQDQTRSVRAIPPEIEALGWDGLSSLYVKLVRPKDEWCRLLEGGA